MQLIKQVEYRTLSDKNRISLVLLPPSRGQIFDITGKILADNAQSFRLLLDKIPGQDYLKELKIISRILSLTDEQSAYITKKSTRANYRSPVTILDQLSWQQISIVEENKPYLTSVFVDVSQSRVYPYNQFTSHLLGYIGQISDQELKNLKLQNRDLYIGKSGIEKYYEEDLKGKFGYKQMEVNAHGKYIRELSSLPSTAGTNLYLNIDSELQEKTASYLNRQGCSAIVMDSHNGGILLLASTPGFEPNNFNKLSKEYWQSLVSDSYKPLINKTVQNNYPPGSAFKLITILAALAAGFETTKLVNCVGGASALGGNCFRCSSKQGHGRLDMFGALKYSCNAYMYEISRLTGADKILEMAQKFGFGMSTGIDMPGEAKGFLPSKEWKKKRFKTDWTVGDTLNLSIGQGFLLATPIQLLRFCAAVSNGGKLYRPSIAKRESMFEQIDVNPQHLEILKEGMYQAINTPGGTSYTSRILNKAHQLAGKTGTAQVQAKLNADDDLSRDNIAWERRNHAVFVGFGPYANPRYSVAVYVDHGGGGGRAAAPIASRIMSDVFEKYC